MKQLQTYSILCLCLFLLAFNASAQQTNLALSAVASCTSTGGALANGWNWNRINDGSYSTCSSNGSSSGQEAFVWSATPPNATDEFTFTWSSPKTMNKMVIHHADIATRFLTGGMLQYWNGTTFVNIGMFGPLPLQCVNTITFTTITTTALRVTNMQMTGPSQRSNANYREIEIFGPTKGNDVGISNIIAPLCSPTLQVVYSNYGTNKVDSAKIEWSVNGVYQDSQSYTNSMGVGATPVTVTLKPDYPFADGTTYTVRAWTKKPNNSMDSGTYNDTFLIKFKYIEQAKTPVVSDIIQCGVGRGMLSAVPGSSYDSVYWYDAASGGNLVAKGPNTLSPFLGYGVKTFYAEASKISTANTLANAMTGTTVASKNNAYYNGTMVNIIPNYQVLLDSLAIRLVNNTAGSTYSVYYRTGGYNGYEGNSSAWTLLVNNAKARVTSSPAYKAFIKIPTTILKQGVQYGFYITTTPTTGNDFYSTSGATTLSNSDVTVTLGTTIAGANLFGTATANMSADFQVFYRTQLCPSSRAAQKITVNPTPTGSEVIPGTPFQDHFRTGIKTDPDISSAGKTVTYELTNPRGYSNASHGTAWTLQSVTLVCNKGYVIPASEYTVVNPTASSNAKVTFKPNSKYVDSTISFNFKVVDNGPYFCDTTIRRVLYVAHTPKPLFRFPAISCDGSDVVFENLSKIEKGSMIHAWDFGDGNTSEDLNVVHRFPGPGTYTVRLTSTSVPFGVEKDTSIQITISDLPKVSFTVTHACEGKAVNFANKTSIAKGSMSYDWDFGDGSAHSIQHSPGHIYSKAAAYKVTLTVESDKGCKASASKNAYQFASPKVSFSTPAPVCAGAPLSLANTSTISTGEMGPEWQYGDGAFNFEHNGTHTYKQGGTYNVKLIMQSEFGCKDSLVQAVVIKPAPDVNFTVDRACSLTPSQFTNNTTPVTGQTYAWTFSDGFSSANTNISHAWATTGLKTVTLKAMHPNGCSATMSKQIRVLIEPKAEFNVADVCSGQNAEFENLSTLESGDLINSWDFGDNTFSSESDPMHQYSISSTRTFNVVLVTSTPGGCSDTAQQTITISELPSCNFTSEVNWPAGYRSVRFVPGNNSYSSYHWLFGDGSSSNSVSPVYRYKTDGNYSVMMIARNSLGCECQGNITVTVGHNQGLGELSADEVNIYPNPNSGIFIIDLDDDSQASEVEIYNTVGELIKVIRTDEGDIPVDMDNAAKGIYIVKVKSKGKTSTRKISIN